MGWYRKLPIEIEAVQLTYENLAQIVKWIEPVPTHGKDHQGLYIAVDTLAGQVHAREGDWIIRGVKGEFYPCRDEIFRETYEAETPWCPIAHASVEEEEECERRRVQNTEQGVFMERLWQPELIRQLTQLPPVFEGGDEEGS